MLTQNEFRKLFDYKDGNLIRLVSISSTAQVGDIVGCDDGNGYLRTMVYGNIYGNHRLIWLWHYGYLPENFIDHIDRNTLNNRIENLREITQSCNMRNTGNFKNNTSGVKGVYFHKQRNNWYSFIYINNKKYNLGSFDDFIEAVATRLAHEQSINWNECDSNSPAFIYIQKWRKTCAEIFNINDVGCYAYCL